ncbi:MAG: DUF2141 domain-containing protein [Gammaproteobacteria bacterium]
MKRQLLLFALFIISLPAPFLVPGVAAADGTLVTVQVTNVVKPEGVLMVGAYTSSDTWLGAAPAAHKNIPVPENVRDGMVSFEMRLPPGNYALSILQDLNGNQKLDTNFLGIPTEPSGSSNDAPARFSAPKFKDALFTVSDEPVTLRITLR